MAKKRTKRVLLRYRGQLYELAIRAGGEGESRSESETRGRDLDLDLSVRSAPPSEAGAGGERRVRARVERISSSPHGALVRVDTPHGSSVLAVCPTEKGIWVADGRRTRFLELVPSPADRGAREPGRRGRGAASAGADRPREAEIRAPMTGRIVRVAAAPGQAVRAGELLVILEAMKMEYRLEAPFDGLVEAVCCEPHQSVDLGDVLVRLRPDPEGEAPPGGGELDEEGGGQR